MGRPPPERAGADRVWGRARAAGAREGARDGVALGWLREGARDGVALGWLRDGAGALARGLDAGARLACGLDAGARLAWGRARVGAGALRAEGRLGAAARLPEDRPAEARGAAADGRDPRGAVALERGAAADGRLGRADGARAPADGRADAEGAVRPVPEREGARAAGLGRAPVRGASRSVGRAGAEGDRPADGLGRATDPPRAEPLAGDRTEGVARVPARGAIRSVGRRGAAVAPGVIRPGARGDAVGVARPGARGDAVGVARVPVLGAAAAGAATPVGRRTAVRPTEPRGFSLYPTPPTGERGEGLRIATPRRPLPPYTTRVRP
ncbi:MAG: hypothetical protein PVJ02_02710 [Gemmatimonadota bacterium]